MLPNTSGSIRLFRAFGIDVYVHWSWFVVAYIQYKLVQDADVGLHFAIYGTLFGIVLVHEFGHALACRSVGGRAERIVLWPLGGIAYVSPPQRPGAVLWSIAAGPLVNVALVPVTLVAAWAVGLHEAADPQTWTRVQLYVAMVMAINAMLLVFNLLPIYPLDGGQIVQAILWFFVGRTKSLLWSARFGLVCAIAIGGGLLVGGSIMGHVDWWLVIVAVFIGYQSWQGIRIARLMAYYEEQSDPWR